MSFIGMNPLEYILKLWSKLNYVYEACWLIGRFVAFRSKGRGFKSRSGRHVETLNKSFTRSCLWRLGVNLRHSICTVSGAPLGSSELEDWRGATEISAMNEPETLPLIKCCKNRLFWLVFIYNTCRLPFEIGLHIQLRLRLVFTPVSIALSI